MSTHKIKPGGTCLMPRWLWSSLTESWWWRETWPDNAPEGEYTHCSDNPKDQPPLGEPAPEETDHKLEDLREARRITRRASDPTPSAPSLQYVAEEPTVRKGAYDYLAAQYRKLEAALTERDERIGRLEREAKNSPMECHIRAYARLLTEVTAQQKANAAHKQTEAGLRKGLKEAQADLTALRTRCEELEEDKADLDFLQSSGYSVCRDKGFSGACSVWSCFDAYPDKPASSQSPVPVFESARAAIRAARKEGQQAHEKGEGL